MHSAVKREAGYVLATGSRDNDKSRRVFDRYDMASDLSVPIPEKDFLRQKRRHRIKVHISKHLDSHPYSSLVLIRLRHWWMDNWRSR
jgi:hypothetical protein